MNYAVPGEVKSAGRHQEPFAPEELVYVLMYGLPLNSVHKWDGACSGWVNSDSSDGIVAAIRKKEALIPRYSSKCKSCWLLIVATGSGGSSFIELSNDDARLQFRTKFHRLFFVEGLGSRAFDLLIAPIDV